MTAAVPRRHRSARMRLQPAHPASPAGSRLRNDTAGRRTLVVEERRWVQDALTADRVATLQAFRDLFSDRGAAPRRRGGDPAG